MKRTLVLFGALAMALIMAVPALAITRGGSVDGDDHPYVGLMVAIDYDAGAWRCSGTLVDATTFVTAGHCTDGADVVYVWTRSDLEDPGNDPAQYGYPFNTTGTMEAITGTAYTYDEYLPNAFYYADLGLVKLDEASAVGEFAELPTDGALDDYVAAAGNGRKGATVTAVGYGLQKAVSNPSEKADETPLPTPTDVAFKTRMNADLMVVDTNGVAGLGSIPGTNSVILSGDSKHGGTCFGDSGGPGLIEGDVLVAVNSFGLNANCAGIGGMYRIDSQAAIDWIQSHMD